MNKPSPNFMKLIIIIFVISSFFIGYKLVDRRTLEHEFVTIVNAADKYNVLYGEDNITVGGCNLSVYTASDIRQKAKGMLGFTDETFLKEGMIFLGVNDKTHYYHTIDMKMDIVIAGLINKGNNVYEIIGTPILARPGVETIKLKGQSILEIPLKKYEKGLKSCIYGNMEIKNEQ